MYRWPAPRSYQDEAITAILRSARSGDGRTFSVMVSRQGGKNELSAHLEMLLLAANAGRAVDGIKCAPTFLPQGRVSLRRLHARMDGAGMGGMVTVEGGNCLRYGRARQFFLSAAPGANVVGHTAGLLLEVDEAQDVDPDKFNKDFRPMTAATNATTVYYGTAWTETDLLAEVRRRHLEMERRDGFRRHFEFDWQTVARHVPGYAAFVAEEQARLGEEHPLFASQYLLRPLPGAGRLFAPATRALLAGTHSRLHGPSAQDAGGPVFGYVAGLDVGGEALAGGSNDRTVLTVARVIAPSAGIAVPEPRIDIVEHAAWQGTSHADLMSGLARLLRDVWRVQRTVIDATGVGEGLAAALAAARGGPEIVRLRLTEERKSALGYGLLAAATSGRLRLYRPDGSPDSRTLAREIELARAEYRPNRRLAWHVDPRDGHDDYLMSLALAVEAARDLRPRSARGRTEDGP